MESLDYWEFLVFEPNIKFLSNVLFSPIRCHSLHVELPQTAGYDHWSVVQSSEHILYKINVYTCSALIAICGVVIQNLIVCFTPPDKIIFVYLASFFSILSICITTVCRSLISKVTLLVRTYRVLSFLLQCVNPWEVGKVFSVIAGLQVNMRQVKCCC